VTERDVARFETFATALKAQARGLPIVLEVTRA
jgi:hypothetical protein